MSGTDNRISDSDVLTFLLENGNVDRATIEQEIEMRNRQKYLDMHKFKVWQNKDGKWYTTLPDKEKGRRLIKRSSKEDLELLIVQHYEEELTNPTFKEVYSEWIEDKLKFNEICKGTYDRYNNDYKRFFGDTKFERFRIRNINEQDIDSIVRVIISEQSLTQKAYTNLRTLILGIFKYAKKKKYTEISISMFFKDLELSRRAFRTNIKDPEKEVFSEDEIPIILKWLNDNPSVGNLGLVLCFQTGIRTGELAALKYSDFEDDRLHIQRQEIKYKSDEKGKVIHEVVEYTKTEAGDRYIYLPRSAINTIRQIRLLNPFGEYMMMENEKRILTNTFPHRLRVACKACGIPERSMHKIRKTYGTTLIDNDVDDSLIMSQMGHKNIQTTRNYYYFANKNNDSKRKQIQNAINF